MAELADALDLGSSGLPVQVQVLLSAPKKSRALRALDFFEIREQDLNHSSFVIRTKKV